VFSTTSLSCGRVCDTRDSSSAIPASSSSFLPKLGDLALQDGEPVIEKLHGLLVGAARDLAKASPARPLESAYSSKDPARGASVRQATSFRRQSWGAVPSPWLAALQRLSSRATPG